MKRHCSDDSRIVNMDTSNTVLNDELAPSRKDLLRFWKKLDNRLKPIHQTGGLLGG